MANPTTNYGFVLPTPTDLVTDLPADFDVALQGVDTRLKALQPGTTLGDLAYSSATANTNTRLAVGTAGQVLTVAAGVPSWATPTSGMTNPMTTTGDTIYSSSGSTPARLGIGTTGQVLTVTAGVPAWGAAPGSPFAADIEVNGQTIGKGASNITTNTAHGFEALDSVTTGTSATAIGYRAGANLTTADRCTAVGRLALEAVTTGADNVAVGYNAGASFTTDAANTAIGSTALRDMVGANNTAIGKQAGENMLTGSNNSYLGFNANGVTRNESNKIVLGNSSITNIYAQVTSITSLSDKRDKKNIEPLEVGLDFVNALKPVIFDWDMRPTLDRDGNEIVGKVDMPDSGFIAQDLIAAEDTTGLVDYLQLTYRENPDKLQATQGRLIPILVKAIQDLSAKVAALEAK